MKDKVFYAGTDGGMTLSGGEVLFQAEFAIELLEAMKENGIHTAIETSGFAKSEVFQSVARLSDLILFDIKHMDSKIHKEIIGAENHLILENIKWLSSCTDIPFVIRYPVVKDVNDSLENVVSLCEFLKEKAPRCETIDLLAYHNLGVSKSRTLEIEDIFIGDRPTKEHFEKMKDIIEENGFKCNVSGF